MGRWFVIGCALMWLGSLIGTNINDMVYALTGRDPVGMVDERLFADADGGYRSRCVLHRSAV